MDSSRSRSTLRELFPSVSLSVIENALQQHRFDVDKAAEQIMCASSAETSGAVEDNEPQSLQHLAQEFPWADAELIQTVMSVHSTIDEACAALLEMAPDERGCGSQLNEVATARDKETVYKEARRSQLDAMKEAKKAAKR